MAIKKEPRIVNAVNLFKNEQVVDMIDLWSEMIVGVMEHNGAKAELVLHLVEAGLWLSLASGISMAQAEIEKSGGTSSVDYVMPHKNNIN